jgi:hypothetical protein
MEERATLSGYVISLQHGTWLKARHNNVHTKHIKHTKPPFRVEGAYFSLPNDS